MSLLRTRMLVSVSVAVAALASIWVYGQRDEPDRTAAAAFLGTSPDHLLPQTGVVTRRQSWGGQRLRVWRLPSVQVGPKLPAATVDAMVDLDLNLVVHAYWYGPARWGRDVSDQPARMTEDQCRERAEAFARDHCPYHEPGTAPPRTTAREDEGVPYFVFEWTGNGPAEREHRISVAVSAVTGDVVEYGFSMRAPQPPATAPVEITGEQAVDIVRRHLPPHLHAERVEVARLWTRTRYAPPGQPVYLVDVQGSVRQEGGMPAPTPFAGTYGVNATTGEFLTELWHDPARQQGEPGTGGSGQDAD